MYQRKKHLCLLFFCDNFRFRIDNTDNIIDIRAATTTPPYVYDSVDIVCPLYVRGVDNDKTLERFVIYRVNKEEYDTCRINGGEKGAWSKTVYKCDTPYKPQRYRISFRSFTPMPGGMEFKPNRDYYFISTSSLEDPKQTSGGMCHSNNMKITFKVRHPKDLFKKKRRRRKKAKQINSNSAVHLPSSSSTPKPFDYFLDQAKAKREDKSVKQEASTSSSGHNGISLLALISIALFAFLNGSFGKRHCLCC